MNRTNPATSAPDGPELDVADVCRLAHFDFRPEETERFQKEMSAIAGYVRKLFEVDVEGVEPTQYGQPVFNVLRDDEPEPPLPPQTVPSLAPDVSPDGLVRMPRIVE